MQGMVVLSGYPSALYEQELTGWQLHTTAARISAGRGTALRAECVWLNQQCQEKLAAPQAIQQLLEI